MSANAFILLNLEPAKTRAAIDRMTALPGAVVHEVLGPYDVILEIEADTPEDITALLRNRIRAVDGVTNTLTCLLL